MGIVKLKEPGWKVLVRTDDHPPPHVHLFRGGRTCRVTIGKPGEMPPAPYPWKSPMKTTMRSDEIVQAIKIVAKHQRAVLEKWVEIHGPMD